MLLSNVPKQKSIWKIAINARFVRARATAIKPELDLMRKNAWKIVSLLFLYTACLTLFPKPELDKTTLHVLSITLFINLFLIATWAISRGPKFNKKIKQKSVWNNAMNARIVRARATAIKPELDLIRKKCLKIVCLVISLHSVSGYFPPSPS